MSDAATTNLAIASQAVKLAKRAIEKNRPLFVLVQYQHEGDKADFVDEVELQAAKANFDCQRYDPQNTLEHGFGKLYQSMAEDADNNVLSLVTSLRKTESLTQLDPDFLSYINLHRDNISQHCLRLILFIHSSEMADFIQACPDLWSFRHKTLYLERDFDLSNELMWSNIEALTQSSTQERALDAQEESYLTNAKKVIEEAQSADEKLALIYNLLAWLGRHDQWRLSLELATAYTDLATCNDIQLSRMENYMGVSLMQLGHFEVALTHLEHSKQLASKVKYESGVKTAIDNIANVQSVLGEYDKAISNLSLLLELSINTQDESQQLETLFELGRISTLNEQDQDAIAYYSQCFEFKSEGQNLDFLTAAAIELGIIYRKQGDLDTADQYFEQALSYAKTLKDTEQILNAYFLLASSLNLQANYDEVIALFLHNVIPLAEQVNDEQSKCKALLYLGMSYEQTGQSSLAKDCFEQALNLSKQLKLNTNTVQALISLSNINFKKGEVSLGEQLLKDALELIESVDEPYILTHSLINIAAIYWKLKKTDKAMRLWSKAFKLAKKHQVQEAIDRLLDIAQKNNFEL